MTAWHYSGFILKESLKLLKEYRESDMVTMFCYFYLCLIIATYTNALHSRQLRINTADKRYTENNLWNTGFFLNIKTVATTKTFVITSSLHTTAHQQQNKPNLKQMIEWMGDYSPH